MKWQMEVGESITTFTMRVPPKSKRGRETIVTTTITKGKPVKKGKKRGKK